MKQEDKLEQRLRAFQKAQKDLKPRKGMWESIASELHAPDMAATTVAKHISLLQYTKLVGVAASVVILLTAAFVLGHQEGMEEGEDQAFATLEKVYLDSIDQYQQQFTIYQTVDAQISSQFKDDLRHMDSTYADLKRIVKVSADPGRVKEAMIQSLTYKIRLLEQQISILNQIETTQKTYEKAI